MTHLSNAQVNTDQKLSPSLWAEIRNKKLTGKLELVITIRNGKIPAEIFKTSFQAQRLFESSIFSVYKIVANTRYTVKFEDSNNF